MDDEVFDLIKHEEIRQRDGLELIPSENYVSSNVRKAVASILTNKYSEGYPGKRYYGGQEFTDRIEQLAIDRAKKLFGADHANVQPHSGAQANQAMYHSWLETGDTIMAMDLSHGGHLTHGAPVTVLSKTFNFIRYKMRDTSTGEFDFDDIRRLAIESKPKMLLVGYSSYPRELDYSAFAEIGKEVGAVLVADIAHIAGLIAGGVLKNPFDYGFDVMTSTTHKTLRGPRGGLILSKGIVSNPLKAVDKKIENLPTLIDRTVFPGIQGGPLMHVIAAKAVCFQEAMEPEFKVYAGNVIKNCSRLAEELIKLGCSLVTGGSDNHLLVIDVEKSFGIDGSVAESALDLAGLTVNKNTIPDDENPPFKPSGIRLGTAAITTRGAIADDMPMLAKWLTEILSKPNREVIDRVNQEVIDYSRSLIDPTEL